MRGKPHEGRVVISQRLFAEFRIETGANRRLHACERRTRRFTRLSP
jgi:hypothetical protein